MTQNILKLPVDSIIGIGNKYKNLLKKLNIETVQDLLYHFPFRYDDFSQKLKIKDLRLNENVTITGYLTKPKNIISFRGKKLTIANLIDESGEVVLIWFNQPYLEKTLKESKVYTVSGKVSTYKNKKCIYAPNIEEGLGKTSTGRLVPIYPEVNGISSKWLRDKIHKTLQNLEYKENELEILPLEIIEENNYPTLLEGVKKLHFPRDLKEAQEARKRFEFEEIFLELLKVEKRKKDWLKEKNGRKMDVHTHREKINSLIASLPFKLTNSQEKAIEEIFNDLQKDTPMNRILEGDVGSGKTIVCLIASYLSYLNNFKTLIMAPTELLANQHFQTFTNILKKFDSEIKIAIKSKSAKNADNKDFDILIGTHALIYSKTQIENLGLVIIDEQHRFGVEQRTMLINATKEDILPNLLTVSATPIPRSLALTIYGDLDVSIIETNPNKKRNVITKVIAESQREKLYNWVKTQNQQTFIVCPFINQSNKENFENIKAAENEFNQLKNILPPDKMKLIHGKINPKNRQQIISEFKEGKIKYLVSTPVIEVGIDVPDASIIIIESAERYGLASLHQLRGRVGRMGQKAYCFLVCQSNSNRSYQRLKALEKCQNGMELAEIDLKMRGQGDIFGVMQSGIKNFKIANIFDIELLKKCKLYAQKYVDKLDNYPYLLEKINESGVYVGQN